MPRKWVTITLACRSRTEGGAGGFAGGIFALSSFLSFDSGALMKAVRLSVFAGDAIAYAGLCRPAGASNGQQCLCADRVGHADRLAAKNAILIVEFARWNTRRQPLIEATLTGARLRLRPILMIPSHLFSAHCRCVCQRGRAFHADSGTWCGRDAGGNVCAVC